MAASRRRTAVLRISARDSGSEEPRALDVLREYQFDLRLEGQEVAAGTFKSPLGDEQWRETLAKLRYATTTREGDLRRATQTVTGAGVRLYRSLRELHPRLAQFLADGSAPRRLVIMSACPEIHQLHWEAMLDDAAAPWRSPADADVSVVRARDVFDETPVEVTSPVTVCAIFGPRTEGRTRGPLAALDAEARKRREPRVVVRFAEDGSADDAAAIVSVEAHGDLATADADLGPDRAFETALGDRLQRRAMALLWSCHSGLVPAWGESLAMKLHRSNAFVLAFATPLRMETSAELAASFCTRAFAGPSPVDPESLLVQERARLYRERQPGCEWAALMLWLRTPVDLSAVTLDGPRILPAGPDGRPATEAELTRLAEILGPGSAPGRLVTVPELTLSGGIPSERVDGYRGTVVHLRADDPAGEMGPALEGLGVQAPSLHRADRFLAVFDRLASYPDSLLLWSGVGPREVDALRLLAEFPRTVTVVLTSSARLAGLAAPEATERAPAESSPPADPGVALTRLEAMLDAGQDPQARELWEALHREARLAPDSPEFLRLQIAGYWTLVRLGDPEAAARCLEDLKREPVEALLVEGNFFHRSDRYDVARSRYEEASKQARDDCDRGRVAVERAYLAQRIGEPELAERLYDDAIRLLEGTTDRAADARWASALGRALRDYAHLLAGQPERADDCVRHLRRGLLIHGLDGRMNQVGAGLRTRAKLERTRKRWEQAEEALLAASAVLFRCRNLVGWAEAMVDLAELGVTCGHFGQTVAVARVVGQRLGSQQARKVRGRLAMAAAQAAWRLGDLDEAEKRSREALEYLAEKPEGISARHFNDALASLHADWST